MKFVMIILLSLHVIVHRLHETVNWKALPPGTLVGIGLPGYCFIY